MAPWVGSTSMIGKDEKIDVFFAKLNGTIEQSTRERIFTDFRRHTWENASAIKAGSYGLLQSVAARQRNSMPYRIPRMWGVALDA
jgi:hypothetical protein